MDVYLPISEIMIDAWSTLLIATAVGVVSGFFGVGGGFLMSPLLFFVGVPLSIASGTQNAQVLSSAVSATWNNLTGGRIDPKLGGVFAVGGIAGAALGVLLFQWLSSVGQIDLVLSLGYIFLLMFVGLTIVTERLLRMLSVVVKSFRSHAHSPPSHYWGYTRILLALPWRMRFPVSRLHVSVLVPFFTSAIVGVLSSLLGIGGSVITVPLLVYFFSIPTHLVIGISLFQTVFVSAATLLFQATVNQNVDVVLALTMMLGGPIGAQLGVYVGRFVQPESVRGLLSILLLGVALMLIIRLLTAPNDLYSLNFI